MNRPRSQGEKIAGELQETAKSVWDFLVSPETFVKERFDTRPDNAPILEGTCPTCGGAGELGAPGHRVPCPVCAKEPTP